MSEISRLLVEQGRAAADARARSGAAWGRGIADASAIPGQVVQQQDAQRMRDQALALQQSREGREQREAQDAHESHAAELDQMRQRSASDWADHLIAAKVTDPAALAAEIDNQTGKLWKPEEAEAIKSTLTTPEHVTSFLQRLAPVRQTPSVKDVDPTHDIISPTGELIRKGTPKVEPPKAVTFTNPVPLLVGGKEVLVRPGSDGKLYDLEGQPVPGAVVSSLPKPKEPKAKFWVVRDGAPVRVSEEEYKQGDRPLSEPGTGPDQTKLEKDYRDKLITAVRARSGGIGAEDAKVQQANHLLSSFEQFYNVKTGGYDIPRVQLNELALGLARLTAPGGAAGVEMMKQFEQKTAAGDIAGALTYWTGQPVAANTNAITKMLKESIERQGATAMENREGEMAYIRGLAPTELDPKRREALEKVTLNPLRQHREIQNKSTGERKLQVSTDGGVTWK